MFTSGKPHVATVNAGKSIYICQCGHTSRPPYCDGSHNQHPGTEPYVHNATKDETLYICGCGKTTNKPWCNGNHSK